MVVSAAVRGYTVQLQKLGSSGFCGRTEDAPVFQQVIQGILIVVIGFNSPLDILLCVLVGMS